MMQLLDSDRLPVIDADRAVWPALDDHRSRELPLAGLRILDLSRVLAGPMATMVLADLGADIIKVEQPGTGDITRTWGPPFHGDDAAYYLAVNRNRRSIVLDLTSNDGRRRLRQLAAGADVLVENYLQPQYEELGLEAIRLEFPHLAWVAIRGANTGGPLAELPAFDLLAQGRSGLMSVTGAKDGEPTKVGAPVMDVVTGLYAAVAVLAGVFRKLVADGPGTTFEVPLFECSLTALINQSASYLVAGAVPQRGGNDHPSIVPYGPIATRDGILLVATTSDRQFAALCRAIGRAELAADARFASNADRHVNRTDLTGILAEVFATETTAEWTDRLQAERVPCAPVNRIDEALAEQQVEIDGLVVSVAHPAGPVRVLGSPYLVDGRRPEVRMPPASRGEHTDEVLAALDAIFASAEVAS